MGRFADAEIGAMSDAELAEFEVLMEAPDPDLLAWLMDQREVPIDQDTPILRRLKAFHTHAAPMDL